MAALYLHQALFASEPSPPPTLAHRSPGSRTPHDRQLSSVSSVTLRTTSHSDHSHPTEPLLHPPSSESSVYLDLLSRQPHHPDGSGSGPNTGLNLEGDPVTVSERRGHWERVVRKRLRRLRWTRRSLLVIIGKASSTRQFCLVLSMVLTKAHGRSSTPYAILSHLPSTSPAIGR